MKKKHPWKIIALLLVMFLSSFGQSVEDLFNMGLDYGAVGLYGFLAALINVAISAAYMMIIPLVFRVVKREKLPYKGGKSLCLWNSIILLILSLFLQAVAETLLVGGVGALIFYFINKWVFVSDYQESIEINEPSEPAPQPSTADPKQPTHICLSAEDEPSRTFGSYNVTQLDLELVQENDPVQATSISSTNIQLNNSSEPALFCRKCGHKLTADSAFCSSCGTQVIADSTEIAYTHERFAPMAKLDNSEQTKSNRAGKIMLVIASIILLVSIGIVVISNIQDKPNAPLTPDNTNDTSNNASNPTVTWLSDYRFQYYEDESKYVLLFELSDENENAIATRGNVKIRIVNQAGTTVYEKIRAFSQNNFENWIYGGTKEMYVAAVYIDPEDIENGNSANGKLYFTVYGSDYSFEEQSLTVYDLPLKSGSGATTGTSSQANPSSGNSGSNTPQQTPQYTCLDPSCNNTVSTSGQYCSEHRCANSGCPYSRSSGSQYCLVCSCNSIGCKNAAITNGMYCSEHTCVASGCTFEKNFGSSYCFSHKCMNCNNGRASGSFYCVEHT